MVKSVIKCQKLNSKQRFISKSITLLILIRIFAMNLQIHVLNDTKNRIGKFLFYQG